MDALGIDREALAARLRALAQKEMELALTRADSERERAGIFAQSEMMPAVELAQLTVVGLTEAGRDDRFIAGVMGGVAGNILGAVLGCASDRPAAWATFFSALIAVCDQIERAEPDFAFAVSPPAPGRC